MDNTIRRSDGQFLTNLYFRILPAQILTMLFNAVNSMADGLIGTNFLGQEAVSAIGLFAPVQLILVNENIFIVRPGTSIG